MKMVVLGVFGGGGGGRDWDWVLLGGGCIFMVGLMRGLVRSLWSCMVMMEGIEDLRSW